MQSKCSCACHEGMEGTGDSLMQQMVVVVVVMMMMHKFHVMAILLLGKWND